MVRAVDGVRELFLVDPDGFARASVSRGKSTAEAAALAALVVSAARQVATRLGHDTPENILIEGRDWTVFVQSLAKGYALLAVLGGEVNLGMVKLYASRHRAEAERLLSRG
jgi:predicted regulator of Ras-like GTPase activity (Roadblock/LC7/MglB family)